MANKGMDVKHLQYIMGHSDVGVTLNVYTHANYDLAAEQMLEIIDFPSSYVHQEQRESVWYSLIYYTIYYTIQQ